MNEVSHKFPHVTTAQLPWYVQICDLSGSSASKLQWGEFSLDFIYKLINTLYDRFLELGVGQGEIGMIVLR